MFISRLKEKGLSVTKQRLSILEALNNIKKPATIEAIKQHIDKKIDRVTLYRSLSALVGVGIVYQTDFREGVAYFELQQNRHHHHLVCTQCKQKNEFFHCPSIPVKKIKKDTGFLVQSHVFEIFGLCESCSETKLS